MDVVARFAVLLRNLIQSLLLSLSGLSMWPWGRAGPRGRVGNRWLAMSTTDWAGLAKRRIIGGSLRESDDLVSYNSRFSCVIHESCES